MYEVTEKPVSYEEGPWYGGVRFLERNDGKYLLWDSDDTSRAFHNVTGVKEGVTYSRGRFIGYYIQKD